MVSEAEENVVSEQFEVQLYFVECDEKVVFKQLFDKHLLQAMTDLEQRYVLKRPLDHLVACGEIDLVFAGENDEGETLYIRTA